MSDLAHEAAAAMVAEDAIVDDVAPVEGEQQETPEPEFEFPSFEADTSGIEDLLEIEPEDVDAEPVYTEPEDVEEEEPVWDDDDEKRKLKSQLAKAEKKLAWEQEQRIKVSSKNWREEAARRFPLADVDDIQATSRRQMLAKAQDQHARYAKKLKPVTDALEAVKAQAIAEVKTEARAQAADAWGQPTSGPQAPLAAQAEDDAKLARGNFRTFQERTLALLKAGKYEI